MPDKKWRHNYIPVVYEVAELMASADQNLALDMARAGVQALHDVMAVAVADEHTTDPSIITSSSISTHRLVGSSANIMPMLSKRFHLGAPRGAAGEEPAPYSHLTGQEMRDQVFAWSNYGCMEESAAVHAAEIADMEDATVLVKDKVFVLLGATSELGPFYTLSRLGATIAAVSRPGSRKMKQLIASAKSSTTCTLLLPVKHDVVASSSANANNGDVEAGNASNMDNIEDRAGADLISDAPALGRWIASLEPGKQLVIVCLAYLDGEKHVRATLGMDIICEMVCKERKDTALSYIVSPATAHAVSEEAFQDSQARLDQTPFWHKLFRYTGIALKPHVSLMVQTKTGLRVLNGLASVQGPNYVLAKTFQQWRAMIARADGHVVSANHGPSTRTDSMVSHQQVAVALEGMQIVSPLVAYDREPAATLMAALMLWDLNYKSSVAHPNISIDHPMSLFIENSVHGGIWRCPYR